MSNKKTKKISRRDALKLLGAAVGATALANLPSKWSKPELVSGVLPVHAQTSILMLPTVETGLCWFLPNVSFNGEVTSDGGASILERGFVWSASNSNPTLADNVISLGSGSVGTFNFFQSSTFGFPDFTLVYICAYATNSVGTAYGLPTSATVCLVEGTLVMMGDGTDKKIEDITYSDWIRVWNFDEGHFDQAQPLWIKRAETINQYNLLEFSDGSSLKTVYQHRIFNKEMGAFTFPMTEDMPIGTTTFNSRGEEVTLVSKQVVMEQVNYYNVITHRHMNLFANGILTSCMYNNVYPIVDMKFVKDERKTISHEQYGVESKYYEGLRLAEQTIPIIDTILYINRLKALAVETELTVA